MSLAAKDSEITDKPESAGSSLLVQCQNLLLEHFGHKYTAVLPKDVIQRLLLGVILFSMLILLHLSVIISLNLFGAFTFYPIPSFVSHFSVYSHTGISTTSRAESDQIKARCPPSNEHGISRHSMWTDLVIIRVCLWLSQIAGVKGMREGAGGTRTSLQH